MLKLALLLLFALPLAAQPTVLITVDAAHPAGRYHPIWNNFGADEPNYTYRPNGTRLLRELSKIDPATVVSFRPHNLLTTGDGTAALKWGSTNVYTEAPDGSPIYNWAITDRLFDNLAATHVRPLVEIGFMPKALSSHPEPYQHTFPKPGPNDIWTGWAYPPNDYAKWRALIVAWVTHLRQRYGTAVESWQWEVWNEPDIGYWQGTPQEYFKLYDLSTGAVRQVLPHARVGGPSVTGGGENKQFLRLFLEHCAHGINADTGQPGVPLDFISFHPKGSPKVIAATAETPAHVRMNLSRQLQLTDQGFQTIASFPEYRATPILLTETDPEGCAACKGEQNGYRNGPLYGVSVAEMLVRSAELARLRGVNLDGAVTWAFYFADQPPFAGFRELATNAPLLNNSLEPAGAGLIDKPVLQVFRLFGKLHGELLPLTSSGALTSQQLTQTGVTGAPDVYGVATRSAHSVDVLVFNYHDEDLPNGNVTVDLSFAGLPGARVRVTEYRVDLLHSDSYEAWKSLGSPQALSRGQLAAIQARGKLQTESPTLTEQVTGGKLRLSTTLPRQGFSLFHLELARAGR